ncbi:MAG: histidinol-phosphate transaminase [Pseudomonadota bacterium]
MDRLGKLSVEMICPYQPGRSLAEVKAELGLERVVKLASNENPLGPSPRVLEALSHSDLFLSSYPDIDGRALRQALAEHFGLGSGEIILGNGSADVARMVADAFLHAEVEAVVPDLSFPVYHTASRITGARVHVVENAADFQIDLAAMLAACDARTRIVWLANPNNPTGQVLPWAQVEAFLDRLPTDVITVLDVAYAHYATSAAYQEGLARMERRERVIVLHTFSKAYGLAGLRCGFGVGRRAHIDLMERVRIPFSVNTAAQTAARVALQDQDHLVRSIALNSQELARFAAAFTRLGLPFLPSQANFVLVDVGQEAQPVVQRLLREGFIVRAFPHPRLRTMLRVTTGTPEQDELFLEALARVL